MDSSKAIANKLAGKIQEQVGHRVDMSVTDSLKCSPTAARFMIEFEGRQPSTAEVSDFFIRQFGGKVIPDMSTAKVSPADSVLVVVANMVSINRPIDDAKKMKTVIAGYTYFDENLQDTWEVKKVNGQPVLARKLKDDISAIVEARRKRMEQVGSKKTFASVQATSKLIRMIAHVEKGDIVKAYYMGKTLDSAEVVEASSDRIKLKHNNETYLVERPAILEVQVKANVENESQLVEYYSKAYGDPEYAKKMVGK